MGVKKYFSKIYIYTVVIPIVLLTTILTFWQYNHLNEENMAHYSNEAQLIKSTVEAFIENLKSEIATIAAVIDVSDVNELADVMQRIRGTHIMVEQLYFTNTDGYITLTTSEELRAGANIAFRDYFPLLLETGEVQVYFVANSRFYDNASLLIVAAPIKENGEITGVLLANVQETSIVERRPILANRENFAIVDHLAGEHILNRFADDDFDNPNKITYGLNEETANWEVEQKVTPISMTDVVAYGATAFLLIMTVFHVIYFAGKYHLEKRNKEEQQRKNAMARLEIVGKMAGIFAHEIRNPLTGISGFTTLLKEETECERSLGYFSVIETELQRLNNIVEEFLVLGKPIITKRERHDGKNILAEIFLIIASRAKAERVTVQTEVGEGSFPLLCNQDHIKQMILNIAINGIQACNQGGLVVISLKKLDQKIIFSVTDNGEGMSDTTKAQAFEPFVTTKEGGTGLGLVVSKQIVEMYGGTIDLESTEGVGTTFTVSFPLS